MGEDLDSLARKFLSNVDAEFRNDPDINEYDVLPVSESCTNRNPIVVIDHKLAIESWAAGLLFCSVSNEFRQWCMHGGRNQSAADADWLCSVTRAILLVTADHMTAWNIRKDLIKNGRLCMEDDLRLGALILGKHPKSCETFAHRKWLISRWVRIQTSDSPSQQSEGFQPVESSLQSSELDSASGRLKTPSKGIGEDVNNQSVAIPEESISTHRSQSLSGESARVHTAELHRLADREFAVCHRAAERYHSNYNAWSHRLWVLTCLTCCRKETVKKELTEIRQFVDTHVSDFSGFHYRQRLLSELYCIVRTVAVSNGSVCVEGAEPVLCSSQTSPLAEIYTEELRLTTDLISRYPGHEAIWYHRRYVLRCLAQSFVVATKSEFAAAALYLVEAHMPPKKTKLDATHETKGESIRAVYDDERLFCEKVLGDCSDASWDATLVARQLRWLDGLPSSV